MLAYQKGAIFTWWWVDSINKRKVSKMTIEITILISCVSVAFAIYFGLKSNRRADEKEIVDKVERDTKINVKLDDIGSDVKEIRYDITETKKQVNEMDKRLTIVEQSSKSAHKRLDEYVGGKEDKKDAE